MDKAELLRQREILNLIDEKAADMVELIQLSNFHSETCPIFKNTKDEAAECDCVVDEFLAKVDAAVELLFAALEEREKDVV